MDRHHKKYIENNLSKLLEYTICSTKFLSILRENKVISSTDAELLMSIQNKLDRTFQFYSVITTRINSFNLLKEALQETNQTGAYQLLCSCDGEGANFPNYEELVPDDAIGIPHICNVFSTVFAHKGKFGPRPVTIQVFRNFTDSVLDDVVKELNILTTCDWHENVLRCFIAKYIRIENNFQFAIAFENLTNLEEYTKTKENTTVTARTLLGQLWNGVSFLHNKQIAHLNLQPQSIFICEADSVPKVASENLKLKIGEFRLAQQLDSDMSFVTVCLAKLVGSGSFETPEVLLDYSKLGSDYDMKEAFCVLSMSTDVFCMGCLFYYILSGGCYAFGRNLLRRKINIVDNHVPASNNFLDSLSYTKRQQFFAMLSPSPNSRPSIFTLQNLFAFDNKYQELCSVV